MPLTIEAQKKALKALKYSDEEINKLVGEGDNDIEVPKDIKVFTAPEFNTAKENIEKDAKEMGRDEGRDFVMKDLKKHFGIDKEGKKLETVADYIKEHILQEAGKTPAAWEAEKKQMLEKLTEKEQALSAKDSELKKEAFSKKLLQALPAERNTDLSNEDYLLLLSNKIEVKEEGGKEVVYYKGEPLKDDKFEALPFNQAITKVWEQNPAWGKTSGGTDDTPTGAGGGDSSRKVLFANMKEVKEHLTKNNVNPLSKEGREFVESAQKSNPKFDATVV